jgi:hypothetical protein
MNTTSTWRVFAFLGTVLVALLAGCASAQMSRIDANREIYETWPVDIKQAVLEARVEVGMTPEMVRVAWGKPDEVVNDANQEVWIYRTEGEDNSMPIGSPVMSGGMAGTGSGIGITTGRGGTSMGVTGGVGLGGTAPGMGTSSLPPPPPMVEKEVVFRDGVVYRADK